jgi:hypothetical protein
MLNLAQSFIVFVWSGWCDKPPNFNMVWTSVPFQGSIATVVAMEPGTGGSEN